MNLNDFNSLWLANLSICNSFTYGWPNTEKEGVNRKRAGEEVFDHEWMNEICYSHMLRWFSLRMSKFVNRQGYLETQSISLQNKVIWETFIHRKRSLSLPILISQKAIFLFLLNSPINKIANKRANCRYDGHNGYGQTFSYKEDFSN